MATPEWLAHVLDPRGNPRYWQSSDPRQPETMRHQPEPAEGVEGGDDVGNARFLCCSEIAGEAPVLGVGVVANQGQEAEEGEAQGHHFLHVDVLWSASTRRLWKAAWHGTYLGA